MASDGQQWPIVKSTAVNPPQEFGATLARLADGRIDPAALVTGEAGFGGLDAAFASLRRPQEHIKVLIRPGLSGTGINAV
ncbi:hypothetical protein OG625_34470 [Streptomyces sp. NBC_01351]|uniref:hypothetical protein n=1 Tax=Streptomyces sp. NBC_01351 TaxID=2903833 RepID=UPI002E36407A|nr:hypothetical protein [Streptomyces sp. NBC_01351]